MKELNECEIHQLRVDGCLPKMMKETWRGFTASIIFFRHDRWGQNLGIEITGVGNFSSNLMKLGWIIYFTHVYIVC